MFGQIPTVGVSFVLVSLVVAYDDIEWTNSEPRSFPCPDSEAIAPCFCEYLNERLYLECSNVTSETQLKDIFREEFPVKEFYSFSMASNDYIEELNFNTNGVSFEKISLSPGPFIFDRLSINFLLSSNLTLTDLILENTKLTMERFPFEYVNTLPVLHRLFIERSNIEGVPIFTSDSLRDVRLTQSSISSINERSFDDAKLIYSIDLSSNIMEALPSDAFAVHFNTVRIRLTNNMLKFIGRFSFYDASINGTSPGLAFLYLDNNQLTQLNEDTIPITKNSQLINLENNQISAITSPNVFYELSEPDPRSIQLFLGGNFLTLIEEDKWLPVMDYLSLLDLKDNPLSCGCDVAWLVLNSAYLNLISAETTCKDGVRVIDLDPQIYADLC